MSLQPPIDVTVPGRGRDPRRPDDAPSGVRLHRVPHLHPDDIVELPGGLRVTSPARTLIDLAEELPAAELRACFVRAEARGLLDPGELRAARARVEWRASLVLFDAVAADFGQ